MIKIDNRNIFFEKLKTGINLFTGAGFSVLESPAGKKLPPAHELADDLRKFFQLPSTYTDLEMISAILKRNCKDEFQKYLKEKYTVSDYNLLYNVLNKITISSIITTNIDNLIPSIIDNSNRYYLNAISYYGPTKRDGLSIEYIPLHGDVLKAGSEFYFGKFEICNANNQNMSLFSMMEGALRCKPTLFWGYGFHDGSVSSVIHRILELGKHDIWIQLQPGNEYIQFFRDLGCNVIESDTENLLKEIDKEIVADSNNSISLSEEKKDIFGNRYSIPSLNQVESLPVSDFYREGKTHWYYALTGSAYMCRYVNDTINASLVEKNVLIIGIPLCGKTMILMQVACKIGKIVYFIDDLNINSAKLICNKVSELNSKITLIVDNCSEDMAAYKMLAEHPNIKTIAASDDFTFESSKHLLDNVSYKKINILDIERGEAQRIYSSIPENLRKTPFRYKENENDKYSMLELITLNVKDVLSKQKIEQLLRRVKTNNKEAFELILLTSYLVYHKSALTTDILIAYYNLMDVETIKQKIKVTQSYLSDLDISIEEDVVDQDYYTLRSALFVRYTYDVATHNFKEDYGEIIKKFVKNVYPCRIYKNYVFRRSAYDANLFYTIFSYNGDSVYEDIFKYDSSAYTLQQWALYKAKTNRFSEAFSDIDRAIHLQPNNFSIRNARAIILFEANSDKSTIEAKNALKEAMGILEECYKSDKRKIYHAQKYAEFALKLSEKHNNDYINQALLWIKELIDKEDSTSKYTKHLYEKLNSCTIRNRRN